MLHYSKQLMQNLLTDTHNCYFTVERRETIVIHSNCWMGKVHPASLMNDSHVGIQYPESRIKHSHVGIEHPESLMNDS